MEAGRKVAGKIGSPAHAGMRQSFVAFGGILLQPNLVIARTLHLLDLNLEMVGSARVVVGVHPEGVIHSLDVGDTHPGFEKAVAVLGLAGDVAGRPLVMAISRDQRSQLQPVTRNLDARRSAARLITVPRGDIGDPGSSPFGAPQDRQKSWKRWAEFLPSGSAE